MSAYERVRAWLAGSLGIPEEAIRPSTRLRDLLDERPREVVAEDRNLPDGSFAVDLSNDSLEVIELVMALEEGLSIELPDDIGEALSRLLADEKATVRDLVDLLE